MNVETIYKLNWQYDYWADIENCFPKGCKVSVVVKNVKRNYAILSTSDGVTCFLDKRNIRSPWFVNDLTEKIKPGNTIECTVLDYNFEKNSLSVSSTLN